MLVYMFIDVKECWNAIGAVPPSVGSSCVAQIRSQHANNKVPINVTM